VTSTHWVLAALLCGGFLLYTYVGYPVVLYILAKTSGSAVKKSNRYRPLVTVIIPAHNEEAVIGAKVQNALESDYPAEKLDVIVVSDASTDGTEEVAAEAGGDRVRVLRTPGRTGKLGALQYAVSKAKAEVLVITDANVLWQPSAVGRLVDCLHDQQVALATGSVRFVGTGAAVEQGMGLYERLEERLKTWESLLWSVHGADGGLYAVRRSVWPAIPPTVPNDDQVIAAQILRAGWRVVFCPDARSVEDGPVSLWDELGRRVGYTSGAMRALFRGYIHPRWTDLRSWFIFLSHKICRWLAPFALVGLLVALAGLVGNVWVVIVPLGAAVLVTAMHSRGPEGGSRLARWAAFPGHVLLEHLAVLVGLLASVVGVRNVIWKPPKRRLISPENADVELHASKS